MSANAESARHGPDSSGAGMVTPFDARSPWPSHVRGPVVFLVDARNRFEAQLLRERIRACAPEGAEFEIAELGGRTPADTAQLKDVIDALQGTDAWLQPLRLIWLPRPSAPGQGLVQDLLAAQIENPGPWRRRRILAKSPERVCLLIGEGASFSAVRDRAGRVWSTSGSGEATAAFVRRQALIVLDRAERAERGARYKVPRLLPRDVFANEEFRERLREIAEESSKSLEEIENLAATYLDEMAATQTPFTLDMLVAIMRAMYTASFDAQIDVIEAQMARVETLIKDRPVAFVMTHKSMLDSMALQCVLFDRNQPMPLTFGGINLNTFGIGALAHRAGVIFLRRSFQDNETYKSTFRRYIDYLIEKRFSLLWALEGTRSRTGKLLPPRYGLFNYVVEAILRTRIFDMTFVPVNITYDQVPEVGDYVIEQQGREKKAEGAGWFVRFIRERNELGRIFLRFGEPLTLADIVPREELDEGLSGGAKQGAVQKLAFETAVRMNDATPITPTAVVTLILLAAGNRAQSLANIQYLARPGMALVRRRRLEVVGRTDFKNPEAVREVLEQLHATGIVSYHDEAGERLYGISKDQHLKAAYYRNTIIHYFITDALIELALLQSAGQSEAQFWEALEKLRDLLKFEFYFRLRNEWIDHAEARLALRFKRWRTVLPKGPEAMREMLADVRPLLAHAVLRSFVDAYSVVARRLGRMGAEPVGDRKALVTECLTLGRQLCLEGRIFSEESVSRALFETALNVADQRGLTLAGPDTEQKRIAFFEELQDLGGRLDEILQMTLKRTLKQEL
ncbi:MAG TPA: 1-acyl-sn-glycerol-3-phosphate acyltransferase [Pseudomonadales bacterium]|nr:1-acyl-sn-glycerol-3-phosphate acyltransferase [Pseudomonadales bacterium]